MATKNVQIRVDEQMKADLDLLFQKFWIDIPTATRMFYAQSLRTHSLPLDLNATTEDQELEKAYYESFDPQNVAFTTHTPEESRQFLTSVIESNAN